MAVVYKSVSYIPIQCTTLSKSEWVFSMLGNTISKAWRKQLTFATTFIIYQWKLHLHWQTSILRHYSSISASGWWRGIGLGNTLSLVRIKTQQCKSNQYGRAHIKPWVLLPAPKTKQTKETVSHLDTQSLKFHQSLQVALVYFLENFKYCYNTKEPNFLSVGLTRFLCVRKASVLV